MSETLQSRVSASLKRELHPDVAAYARLLGEEAGALAVLFYGSNLRTGSLEGVLDFYVLLPGPQRERIWPLVSYREWKSGDATLRAKIATMSLEQFAKAAEGKSRDTTIWARFVQPSALAWTRDPDAAPDARPQVAQAICAAARTASRLAAALGPGSGTAEDYWRALFQATYQAEFRVEKAGREDSILSVNRDHFEGLLPLAWDADGIAFKRNGEVLAPAIGEARRAELLSWWAGRRRFGKPLNLLRLAKATTTFDGAADYAAWKVERHTGVPMKVTPFRRKYPLLAAPAALWEVWRAKSRVQKGRPT